MGTKRFSMMGGRPRPFQIVRVIFRILCICVGTIGGLWANGKEALADFGPKGFDLHVFRVTQRGEKWTKPFVAALLVQSEVRSKRTLNMSKELPGLEEIEPTADGRFWTYANYAWGGEGKDGTTIFQGFYGPIPYKFRLAIYSLTEKKIHLSDEVSSHPLLMVYDVDIAQDRLVVTQPTLGLWIADQFWGLQRHGFWWALLVTWAIEVSLLLLCVQRWKKGSLWRFAGLGVSVNLATLGFLWVCSLIAFWFFGFEMGLVVFWGLEIAVVFIEAVALRVGGKFSWQESLGFSTGANAATILVGVLANGWLT